MSSALAPPRKVTARGFTLMELVVVLGVLGVLVAIAVPTYQDYVRKARRADAKLALTNAAQRLERCFGECNSYVAGACPAACPTLPIASTEGYYEITAAGGSAIAATTFTLVATPVSGGAQASDGKCTSFTLNQLNVKSAAGSDASNCWE